MDHLDGFDALLDQFAVCNFWDTGVRRAKPDFAEHCTYREADWDRYVTVRDGEEEGVATGIRRAGAQFAFGNKNEKGEGGGDGLYILAPDRELVNNSQEDGDLNDSSYVILYRSSGGRVLLPGDAHDDTWDYVTKHYAKDVAGCSFMLALHHGRDSDREYEFLDHIRPTVTLIGCAPSEHIDYSQWRNRNLECFTSNQAGNVVLDIFGGQIDVYVENVTFAKAKRGDEASVKNSQGYAFLYSISKVNAYLYY
jgi:beta-lactamase superfamily II metal-dependent hydrolase